MWRQVAVCPIVLHYVGIRNYWKSPTAEYSEPMHCSYSRYDICIKPPGGILTMTTRSAAVAENADRTADSITRKS